MSVFGESIRRSRRGGSRGSPFGEGSPLEGPHRVVTQTLPPAAAPPPVQGERSELQRRRDALAAEVTEMHWDLGGLAYEMAIRDHFRLDVLLARAALLQERDAELAEIERLLRLEDSASAGSCPACAAPHSRGAMFCWQCGATLMERRAAGAGGDAAGGENGSGQPTEPLDALLAGEQHRDGRPVRRTSAAEE
jgi:hypothetical protein